MGENYLRVETVFSKYRYHDESKSVSQNAGFARDYGRIFSRLLRSVPQSEAVISKMKKAGFYSDEDSNFAHFIHQTIAPETLELALYYNLLHQLVFYYEALDLKSSYQLVSFLKQEAPAFFEKNSELKAVHWRSKWLNKPLMQLLRKMRSLRS